MKKTRSLRLLSAPLLATVLTAFSLASHAADAVSPYTELAVFGDSLSDSGNNRAVLGTSPVLPTSNLYIPAGAPYASGTYSNGPVWVSSFASNLGLASYGLPSLAGGFDFAFGGARTSGSAGFPASATSQVSTFLGSVTNLPASGLYVIAVGGNDVRDAGTAIAGGASLNVLAAAYANSVGAMVDSLQARGAQHIVVWDAPDVGKTPFALSTGTSAGASAIAGAFNVALATRLTGEAGVSIFDVYSFLDGVVASPGAYGLVNVTDACGAVVYACSASLSTSLFYDGIHPTAAGQLLIATAMTGFVMPAVTAVPEPTTWALLGLGLALVTLRRSRRA